MAKPLRNWFFLGGGQGHPVSKDQWVPYEASIQLLLNSALDELDADGKKSGGTN